MSIAILIIVCVILVISLGSLYLTTKWYKEIMAQPVPQPIPLVKVPATLDEDSVIVMDEEHEESVLRKPSEKAPTESEDAF